MTDKTYTFDEIINIINEMERQYYDARPTSNLALHPFRELRNRLKNE
ncbi:MAG: hypothetical protein RLZZ196_205 [Bacteroidota bacterium]|jgi:hypothetical protein